MSAFRYPSIAPRVRLALAPLMFATLAFVLTPEGASLPTLLAVLSGWLPAVWLTDKYHHKYPARFWTYVLASHAKAALVQMVLMVPATWWVVANGRASWNEVVLMTGAGLVGDLLLSLPSTRNAPVASVAAAAPPTVASEPDPPLEAVNTSALAADLVGMVPAPVLEAFSGAFQGQDTGAAGVVAWSGLGPCSPGALVRLDTPVNDLRDIDQVFNTAAQAVPFGGFFVCRYLPHHVRVAALRGRTGGGAWFRLAYLTQFAMHRVWPKLPRVNALYFGATGARNRMLSKVEVWGRLSYTGWRVVVEVPHEGKTWVLAQRVSHRPAHKRPSYYPVVPLEKVGLGGSVIHLHKIRSMFPYSEFLQKRMFEDHGLTTTGKFANDFRLTEYGPFIRKYWIDELPQWLDWLRGDVKLVGMRATSRHYLSLYPPHLIDLYLRTKPGLIPPIFDESTPGFDGIVATELRYLERYQAAPIRTDTEYFFRTLSDIFLRGVRSK